jgi:glycosyltransferase involved in cell wall biosynthesis
MNTRQPRFVQIVTVPLSFWLVRGQADAIAKAGFEVHAVSSPGGQLTQHGAAEHVTVHAVPMARRVAPWSDFVSLLRLTFTLARIWPDVVQAGTPKAALLGTLAAWFLRVRTRIYYVHGLPLLTARGLSRWILLATEKLTCATATHVICVSHSVRGELIAHGLCKARKAIVLANGSSNGIDTAWFSRARVASLPGETRDEVRDRLGIPRDALVVGFIGRLGRDKGIGELQRAWQDVRQRCASAYLLVVGPPELTDPPDEGALASLASDPRVRMIGEDWNTAPLYMAMDVFCLPSYREGLPNVVLEAGAMELPVVGFQVSGMVDAVDHGRTGRLVRPLDVAALVEALHGYLRDADLRARHGAAGRRRAIELFRRATVWAAIEAFHRSLNPRPRHHAPNTATQCTDAA